MNDIEFAKNVTNVYLKHLIPIIRDQKPHRFFDWNDAIDYLIDRLEEMKV